MREGFQPVILDTFGGRCTLIERGDLPQNLSPDSLNVEFFPGGVKSRVGFTQLSSQTATGARYSSVISFVKSTTGTPGRLLFRWDGKLQNERPTNSFSSITGGDSLGYDVANSLPHYMNGLQIEDDVYFALSNGRTPEGRQRRYNITGDKMRPLAPSGPYDTMVMSLTGGTLDTLPVYGVVVFEYEDGTLSPCSTSAYSTSKFEPTSMSFTKVPLGPAGVVRRRIYMTTRSGSLFYTHPNLWINDNTTYELTLTTLLGNLVTDDMLTNGFPLPDYCKDSFVPPPASGISTFNGRTLLYGLMNMIPYRKVDAEVTGQGFAPMWLELGVQNPAFDAGLDYNARTAPSGFLLETYANGFADTNNNDPVGGSTFSGGGQYGSGWKMTGDGIVPSIGQINATINGYNLAQIAGDQKLGIRIRARKTAGLSNSTAIYVAVLESYSGNVIKTIQENTPAGKTTITVGATVAAAYNSGDTVLIRGLAVSGGADTLTGLHTIVGSPTTDIVVDADTNGLTYTDNVGRIDKVLGYLKVTGTALKSEWKWFGDDTTVSGVTLVPVDQLSRANSICIMMSGGTSGIPTGSESILLDEYNLFPSTQPFLNSSIYGSEIDDPNHFRGGISELQVNPQDGQAIKSVFDIRGNCYVVKESSMWTIGDNGLDFAAWDIGNVSPTVGTPSLRGVGLGEGFAIIASTKGVFAFYGGVPEKISDEIQPDWDTINWTYGHLISVVVDSAKRRVLINAPTSAATQCNKIFVLDFFEGFGNPIPSGNGRKWTIWTLASGQVADQVALTIQDNTTTRGAIVPCIVGGATAAGSGFVAIQDPAGTASSDTIGGSSTAINAYYETASVGLPMGRSLFGFLMAKIKGSGTLSTSFSTPAGVSTSLTNYTLTASPLHDAEWKTNKIANQLFYKMGTNAVGEYWSLKRLSVELKRAFSHARGHNA